MYMHIYIYICLKYTYVYIYIRILKYRESLYPSPHKFLPHSLRHCRRTVCRPSPPSDSQATRPGGVG